MAAPKRKATYDDLCRVPDTMVAEIVDGELYASPRPAMPHARAEVAIARALAPFDDDPSRPGALGGWWILMEPELHLGEDILVPDLAGWRRSRLPAIPNAPALALAPDWICEIVSPRSGRLDRSCKMPVYAREGVERLWLVDPLSRTLEVYRLESGHWVVVETHGDAAHVRAVPFDALELDLSGWWLEEPAAQAAR
jgi:Uma2 family endonuclease